MTQQNSFIRPALFQTLLNATMVGLIVTNMIGLYSINNHFSNIEKNMLFDIDAARNQMHEEMGYMYMRGCLKGANEYSKDAAAAYQKAAVGFNVNSPTNFCYDAKEDIEPYIMDQITTMGKKDKR